jgi:hypothetical protein
VITDAVGRAIDETSRRAHRSRLQLRRFTAVAGSTGWDRVVGFSNAKGGLAPIHLSLPETIPRTELRTGNTDDSTFSLERLISLRPDLVTLPEWAFTVLQDQVGRLRPRHPGDGDRLQRRESGRHVASTLALGLAMNNEDSSRARQALHRSLPT